MDLTKHTVKELLQKCSDKNITNVKSKKKMELIALLEGQNNNEIEAIDDEIVEVQETETINTAPESNHIYHGNCIEYMQKMEANSVDMVCTDPPYFLDGLGDDWNKDKLDAKGSSFVIGNLPTSMKFDRKQSKKFYEFYTTVSKEAFRILKPGGAFLSFSSPRLYHSMAMAIEDAGFEIRDMLGWIYTQSQVKAFSQDHIINNDKTRTDEQKETLKETCKNWRTPQLKPAIEPICLAVKPTEGRLIDNFDKYGTGLMNTSENTKVGINNDYFPSNIVTTEHIDETMDKVFLVSKPNKEEKGTFNTHVSVKPVSLISHLIKLFTKENALVLDPFMGSGTTAVACITTNRKYIGYDLNVEYIQIANKRIENLKDTPLV